MSYSRLLLVAAAIVCPLVLASCGESEEEVRQTFDDCMEAYSQRNAEAALAHIDPSYVEHFDYLVKMARTGARDRVMSLPVAERMEIVAMRNRLTRAELAKIDGAAWLRRGLEEGWRMAPEDPRFQIGRVKFRMPRASGVVLVDGLETDLSIEFVKTGDKWFFDPRPLDEIIGNFIAKRSTSGSNLTLNIRQIEEARSGKTVTDAIWDPPK